MFYTDYSKLCTKLSETYRKKTKFESDENLKQRHRNYWNWGKILNETVHCWGNRLNYKPVWGDDDEAEPYIPVLYHGISFIYFNGFTTTFNSPTSMTPEIEVYV